MQSNVDEIISYMEKEFRPYGIFDQQLKQITRALIERGYTLDEITRGVNTYLFLLEPKSSDHSSGKKLIPRAGNYRILDRDEQLHIRPGAYGYLCLLREMSLLGQDETEKIIEYICEIDLTVETAEDLQAVMLALVTQKGAPIRDDDLESGAEDEGDFFWHVSRRKHLI